MISISKQEWDVDIAKCRSFAQAQYKTSRSQYRRRNQSNPDRIISQIVDGKMGELMVERHLIETGFSSSSPDFEIYTARNKSFDADLFCGKVNVHVKTQSAESAQRYGASWVFQAGGVGFGNTDPCLDNSSSDWCVFVTLDAKTHSANLVGPLDIRSIRPHFKDPKLQHLIGIKKCIYLADIQHLETVLAPSTTIVQPTCAMDCLDNCIEDWLKHCSTPRVATALFTPAQRKMALDHGWITRDSRYDIHKMLDSLRGRTPLSGFTLPSTACVDVTDSENEEEEDDGDEEIHCRKKRKL